MNKIIIAFTLLIISVSSQGACEDKLQCQNQVFGAADKALCLGFRTCLSAEFATELTTSCSGALACQDATITTIPPKFLCNGFESCLGMNQGIKATKKVACNGLKACQGVIGKLQAPVVACDGDIACNNKKIVADGGSALAKPVENLVTCNGKKACFSTNIISKAGRIDCDGDTACKGAQLTANIVSCGGKRGCYQAKVRAASTVYAYGFNAIANAQILGTDASGDETIRALGMNAIMGSTITTGKSGTTTILAYGYRAMVGAAVSCLGKATCVIKCRMNACKDASVYVNTNAILQIDPIACDPRDPGFEFSKKDPTLPGKSKGIHCPFIYGPGIAASDADLTVEQWEKAHFDRFKKSVEYQEMIESAEIAEQSLDAMINEQVSLMEDNMDINFENKEQELMVVGQSVFSSSSNHMIASNLLTGLIVFIITLVGSLCYIAYKFGDANGETKALLQ